eukprot:PhM_4_TR11555/c0_g1_i1/m.32719/K02937/RP-L7e, RPL7; large subunit ribosomal protein L7e
MPRAPETQVKKGAEKAKVSAGATERQQKMAKAVAAKYLDAVKRGTAAARAQRRTEHAVRNWRRVAREQGKLFAEPGAKVAFVVRTKGIHKIAPRPRKILTLFRLRQLGNGVFVRLNQATMPMLRAIEPYCTYGQLSANTVRQLVLKRGFAKVDKKRIRISSNDVLAHAYPTKAIRCVDDIVNEIVSCGPNFKQVTSTLWPFKLSAPLGGFNQKRRHFVEGGDFGNREALMNDFVKRCL